MDKTWNNRAWFMVLPVLALVAFNAIIPLMTVVNYSVQETFGDNVFFFEGVVWFEQVLNSDRFHAALGRQLTFTFTILAIESFPQLAWLLVPFASLVAASRVVLGLHYPTDVVAGAVIGSALAVLSMIMFPIA